MQTRVLHKFGMGLAAVVLTASVAGAQTDPRWRAWTGCWAPVSQNTFSMGSAVCVLPTEKPSAVEIVTVVGAKIADRTRIDADGMEHAVSRDGCTGTEFARWSATGSRVHITETVTCIGGGVRRGTGIMSFNQQNEWLDVRGLASGGSAGVAVARYRLNSDTAGLPAEVAPALALRGPTGNNAILAASAPLTLADIADVGTAADSGVAATWLVERTRDVQLSITGKQLAALVDQGVPASVVDVIVALAHPRVFALNSGQTDPQLRDQPSRSSSNASNYLQRFPSYYGGSLFYDPWYGSFGYYSPFNYYGGYGYRSGYGYGDGYGYGSTSYGYGYYPGTRPIVVVNQPTPSSSNASHGRVTRGRGYTSGSGSSSSGSSYPSSSSSGSSGSSSSGGNPGGSTGGGSASSSSSSSGGGGGDRVAVRKPPQ